VEGSTVYKRRAYDCHTNIVSMTSIVVKFNKELCQTEDKVTTPYYAAKLQASYLKTLKGTILPDTEDVTLLECYRIIHFLWQDENSN
jgi:hypothetical protein